MIEKLRILVVALLAGLCCFPALAQDTADEGDEPVAEIDEVLVVTASRTEQKLHDVPAAITVMTSEQLETLPADDFGDLLRNVPGLNVTQIGTRDVQVSSRTATGSLSTGQLVLVDGRTVYLDFFGFVIWEYLPANPNEIKQVEVVRGPGSSVWGANAMNGVINVITKSPRELDGTYLTLGGGELSTAYANLTHAGVRDDFSFKITGGYYQQDEPYDRPTGFIPGTTTPYPPFQNEGTEQPKIDLRFDWDKQDSLWSVSSGYAATDGIVHTGIGPFDVDKSSNLSYAKVNWSRRALNITGFANFLDGDASNLLTVGTDGLPLQLGFASDTYNIDITNTSVVGDTHILTYGANARHNSFDLTIAPAGDNRDELGVFLQDEILLGDHFRWVVGARVDDIDPIDTVVSPRTTLMYSPNSDHTFRLSFNRAFRSPSLIENFLDIEIISGTLPTQAIYDLSIAPLLPFPLPCEFVLSTCETQLVVTDALGNPQLGEEQLDAFEIGYVGTFGKTTFTASVYRNELSDNTDFFASENYTPFNVPAGWPRFLIPLGPTIPAGAPLFSAELAAAPRTFTYRNVGETINEGIELSLQVRPKADWIVDVNYSYQETPEVTGIPEGSFNIPPESRFNLGVSYNGERFYANGNVNAADDAFWTDVLDSRFFGTTDSYTMFNLGFGFHFLDGRGTFGIIGSNIFDEDVQQHVFGDIISRKISGEFRFRW